jgi:hypothetical protein
MGQNRIVIVAPSGREASFKISVHFRQKLMLIVIDGCGDGCGYVRNSRKVRIRWRGDENYGNCWKRGYSGNGITASIFKKSTGQ